MKKAIRIGAAVRRPEAVPLGLGRTFERPAATGTRPLEGMGPWTLVEVADAFGTSYDSVYLDARCGTLATQDGRRLGTGVRYLVSIEALRNSPRPCYRRIQRATVHGPTSGAGFASQSGANDARPSEAGGNARKAQLVANVRTFGKLAEGRSYPSVELVGTTREER